MAQPSEMAPPEFAVKGMPIPAPIARPPRRDRENALPKMVVYMREGPSALL